MGIGPSTKETSLHHFRDPLLEVVSEDTDLDLLGLIVVGTPDDNKDKMLVGTRAAAMAECMPEIELIDNVQKPVISIEDNVVRVTDAFGMTMSIYNLAGGAPVMSVKIDSQDKRFDLNLPKGIYIVKVGKIARKIVIK